VDLARVALKRLHLVRKAKSRSRRPDAAFDGRTSMRRSGPWSSVTGRTREKGRKRPKGPSAQRHGMRCLGNTRGAEASHEVYRPDVPLQ
jgi:hypothetical protein